MAPPSTKPAVTRIRQACTRKDSIKLARRRAPRKRCNWAKRNDPRTKDPMDVSERAQP
jgi:hypothetical protein